MFAARSSLAAYNVENGRNSKVDTWDIGLRDLAEYYFVPLKACINKADVGAFMCTSPACVCVVLPSHPF